MDVQLVLETGNRITLTELVTLADAVMMMHPTCIHVYGFLSNTNSSSSKSAQFDRYGGCTDISGGRSALATFG